MYNFTLTRLTTLSFLAACSLLLVGCPPVEIEMPVPEKETLPVSWTAGSLDGDMATTARLTADGGFIIGGAGSSGILVLIEGAGDVVWSKAYPECDSITAVCVASEGGFYAAGSSDDRVCILRVNTDGDKVWSKVLEEEEVFGAMAICEASGGGCLVTAKLTSGGARMFSLDDAGEPLWSKTLDIDAPAPVMPALSVTTSDGGFVVAGGGLSPWLLKVASDGDEQWFRTYPGEEGLLTVGGLAQSADGGYILLSQRQYYQWDFPSYDQTHLRKINSNGSLCWTRYYAIEGLINHVSACPEGGCVFGGREQLFHADSYGTLNWFKEYQIPEGYTVIRQVAAGDNGYLAVGTWGHSGHDAIALRLDEDGAPIE